MGCEGIQVFDSWYGPKSGGGELCLPLFSIPSLDREMDGEPLHTMKTRPHLRDGKIESCSKVVTESGENYSCETTMLVLTYLHTNFHVKGKFWKNTSTFCKLILFRGLIHKVMHNGVR